MREIVPENAADYLRETGRVPDSAAVAVQALGWGVSNVVMRVDAEGMAPFVLKQGRARLRTKMLWVSRLERIWTEQAALELLDGVLPEGAVPRVLFADRANYLFAMTCAPDDSTVWKERLLAGEAESVVARRAGEILGTMHAATVNHPGLTGPLADLTVFDELRIDPFYRTIAVAHPEIADRIGMLTVPGREPPCFVHADFSPKNILVHGRGLTVVDFETAHAGDRAFDLGFFLSHLLLKAVRAAPDEAPLLALIAAFWEGYRERSGELGAEIALRVNLHAAACALARVDGKSPVDYLDDPARRDAVRRFALQALRSQPPTWDDFLEIAVREVH